MITVEAAKRAVQDNFDDKDWFLICLRGGGWRVPKYYPDHHFIYINNHSVQIGPQGKHSIQITVTDPRKKLGIKTEAVSIHSQPLVLHNTIWHLLITSRCLEQGQV